MSLCKNFDSSTFVSDGCSTTLETFSTPAKDHKFSNEPIDRAHDISTTSILNNRSFVLQTVAIVQ